MNPENQKIYFQNYIDSLRIKDNEDRKRKEQEVINADFGAFDNVGSKQNENDNSGMFYFYNVQLVGLGKQEFKNKYGNRPLADNWIISEKSGVAIANVNNKSINFTEENTQRYDVNYYLSQIPTNENQLDSIKKQRSDAYYNLGLIYKEQFKEFELATEDFENFLNKNPIQKLILPAYYQLYKTYANFDLDLSNKYRDKIVYEYPDSRYSEIIKNPNKVLVSANNVDSPEYIYKNAYICYDEEEYEYALTSINKAFEKYKGLEIESKFELLKAYITLKIKDESAFIERLNFVIINYPNTEESKHAESVLEKILSKSVKNKTKGEL